MQSKVRPYTILKLHFSCSVYFLDGIIVLWENNRKVEGVSDVTSCVCAPKFLVTALSWRPTQNMLKSELFSIYSSYEISDTKQTHKSET